MQKGRRSPLKPLLAVLALALTGGLVLPIAGYVAGKRTIGAYAGRLGLSDYLGSIYAAAFRGELLAWWLLLTPALTAAVWFVLTRIAQRAGGAREG